MKRISPVPALRSALASLLVAAILCGCQKASESTEAKRMPKPPPPPASSADIAAFSIGVEIDGATVPPLTAAKLDATTPDYRDDEHRAWRLSTLLGGTTDREGAVIAVTGQKDLTIVMRVPKVKDDSLPVLSINRRGEVMIGLVPPDHPFPAYHGQGGRLARPGDPLPRIAGVTKIRVYVESDAGTGAVH